MAIGIWGGNGKPSSLNEFLGPLANDIDMVTKSGVIIKGYRLEVNIRSFPCDAPARSFLKGFCFA